MTAGDSWLGALTVIRAVGMLAFRGGVGAAARMVGGFGGGGIAGGARGLGGLSRAGEFGIRPYAQLRHALQGTELQAHHLIEHRFAHLFEELRELRVFPWP